MRLRSFRGFLTLSLLILAMLNALQFQPIERRAGQYYSALTQHGDSELINVVRGHMSTTRNRFLMYLELGEVTQNPTIVIYDSAWLHNEELYALSSAEEVIETGESFSLSTVQARTLRERAVHEGEQREAGAYVIAVDESGSPDGGQRVYAVMHNETLYLVEDRLLRVLGETDA